MDAQRPGIAGQAPPVPPPAAGSNDAELIASLLRKDRKAAARFVTAHVDAVYAFARHRLAPRTDLADDVVQDVFLAALNGLASFQGQSSVRTWLLGIARHKIEDVYRQRLRLPATLDEVEAAGQAVTAATPVDEAVDTERARVKARRVLAALPERYAVVLLWRYWEQRSTREMATAIGTTEKSVERLLARARAHFKALWSKE